MCGIAGFVDFSGQDVEAARALVSRMTDVLEHRGPDDSGVFADSYAALGHRRLAIIDLDLGHQPMSDGDGHLQIVFNGEIYNFLELQQQLRGHGHEFRTGSDTEVILKAYHQWGQRCVEYLNGMFAFAIWDAKKGVLLLARDRVGKKPLYYFTDGSRLFFSSEIKGLKSYKGCPDSIDPEALDCYLSLGYIPSPKTIWRGVNKLRPAHTLVWGRSGLAINNYWQLNGRQNEAGSFNDTVDRFSTLLDETVAARLISDVPLGAFLSGGLDSSLVVASMKRALEAPVLTHTVGFDDGEFSEIGPARQIAEHLQTDHREFVVQPAAVDVLAKIAWHFDEPFADSSALPTWYLCQAVRQSVTVALSGDGGDEGFGGYSFRYLPHLAESRLRSAIPSSIRRSLFSPLGAIWPASRRLPRFLRLKSILENLAGSDVEAFYHDLVWLRDDARIEVYQGDYLASLQGFTPFEMVQPYYAAADAADALARAQLADINVYMLDDVLVKVDRMSMAHSLEVRSPLLDFRMLEFAVGLPANHKVNLKQGKLPLRALAARQLPQSIARHPKRGFSIPAARWLREDLRDMAEAVIFRRNGIIGDTLNDTVVRRFWQHHLSGSRDYSVFFWGLMMLGLWEQECATPSQVPGTSASRVG